MSESYRLPSRRNRSKPEDPQHRQNMLSHDKPGRWSHDKHDPTGSGADPDDSGADSGLRASSARMQRALVSTGLDSSSGSDDEEEEQQTQQQQKKKRRRASDAAQEEDLSGSQHEQNSAKKRSSKRRPTLDDLSEEPQHVQQQQEKKRQSRSSHAREEQSPGLNPLHALDRGKHQGHLQEASGQTTNPADR